MNDKTIIKLNDIARDLSISEATIRNWIKQGLLSIDSNHNITKENFNSFKHEYVGIIKLNKRANKLHKEIASEKNIDIKDVIAKSKESSIDMSIIYESMLSESYKNKEGIYYTRENIIRDVFLSINRYTEIKNKTFLDPSCGSGNYIIEAIKNGIDVDNIYGYDTDEIAIDIAKYRIKKLTGKVAKNVKCRNFLDVEDKTFDIIATNPPWGKKIDKQKNKEDSFALFIRHAIRLVCNDGFVSMLVPSALNNIFQFKSLREFLLEYSILEIKDYGKAFYRVIESANNIIIKKSKQKSFIKCINSDETNYKRLQKNFSRNPNCIFNYYASNNTQDVINHIYSYPHKTLKNNAKWALGIVTGNNALHVSKIKNENMIPVYRGIDIIDAQIKESSEYIKSDFSNFQQVAADCFYNVEEKIVYRFISSNLSFAIDNKKRYFLNSANIIIPFSSFELTNKQIVFLANSKIMNFIFKSIFNTHKVLRSDIEMLPLWNEFFDIYKSEEYKESNLLEYLSLEERNGSYKIKKPS